MFIFIGFTPSLTWMNNKRGQSLFALLDEDLHFLLKSLWSSLLCERMFVSLMERLVSVTVADYCSLIIPEYWLKTR